MNVSKRISIYLQTMIEVVEKGGVTCAAESLCVTPSAVSRRLKFLEDYFGQELLDRSGKEAVPTAAGRVICDKARRILDLERELQEELRGRDWVKPLRFCCTPAFGMSHLPRIMSLFMQGEQSNKGIEIHFEVPDRILSGMDRGIYDLSILDFQGCCPSEDLSSFPLPGDEIVFLSCACLGLREGEIGLSDLFAHTLITRKKGCCSRRCLETNLEASGYSEADFQGLMIIDDLALIAQALRAGQGLTYLPPDLFRKEIEGGEFRVHRVPEFDHCRSRSLLVNPARLDDPLVQTFVSCIKTVVAAPTD